MEFRHIPAAQKLTQLAQTPPDLTRPDTLTPERIAHYQASACGFDLFYATQRVNEEILTALGQLADETGAVAGFGRMMAGEIMNRIEGFPSENRQVLHTATRNVFDDLPNPAPQHEAEQAVYAARKALEHLELFLLQVERGEITNAKGQPFTDMINIGIGGSDLGPRALYMALRYYRLRNHRVHYVSNVDPDDMAQALAHLDLSRTLVNVVSKSGSTLETLTNETLARKAFTDQGLDPARHFVCVTGKGSPMDDPTRYLASFYMYDYIGGRYASTSMVGGVSLGFALGFEGFSEILRGAREMDLAALEPNFRKNVPLMAALLGVWNRTFLGHHTLAVLPYSQALERFVAHLQQLDMESNGKRVSRQGVPVDYPTGPIVWGEPGTNGQHAFYQLIHQSPTVVPCEFVGFRQTQWGRDLEVQETTSEQKLMANLFAQSIALAQGQRDENPNRFFAGNRPNWVLLGGRLTPRAMGSLLAFYEHKVAFQGLLWNINSFDQEGVQLGKTLANHLLAHMKRARNHEPPAQDDPVGLALLQQAGLL